ncbi:Retrovirus-related Pol polyprotein from transposon opus [Dictyocoela muelleri]|nr:Retrovirus-related Pol polyprotein from transposon opus [Dictyocoela muelleri]
MFGIYDVRSIQCFCEIKYDLILLSQDFNFPLSLFYDASDIGIGSVLMQIDKVIGYYSKKYTQCEKNYTVVEKEVLAILKSVQHFKQNIFNTKINIYTDNAYIIFKCGISRRRTGSNLYYKIFIMRYIIFSARITHTRIFNKIFKSNQF